MGYKGCLVPSGKLSADPAQGPRLYQLATAEVGEGRIRDRTMEVLLADNIRINLPGALALYLTFRRYSRDLVMARSVRQEFVRSAQLSAGQPVPAFTLLDNTGKRVVLSNFRGKVVHRASGVPSAASA